MLKPTFKDKLHSTQSILDDLLENNNTNVQDLTSFIQSQSHNFLRDFELYDTTLIIDGNHLLNELYLINGCVSRYGGDYMDYGYHVNKFFDELQMCKVTPIVILDGALEDTQIEVIFNHKKAEEEEECVSNVFHEEVFPLFLKDVFIYLASQRNIKIVTTTLQAKNHIASVAKLLNCPVLSLDTDFYIFDVMYIPCDTLKLGYIEKPNNFVKNCKIFDRNSFLQKYRINQQLLTLAAAVLGNNYINSRVFNDFFYEFSFKREWLEKYSSNNFIIKTLFLFEYIQKYTLSNAVHEIIKKLDSDKQPVVFEMIKIIINRYLNSSPKLLYSLKYSLEEVSLMMQNIKTNPYILDENFNLNTKKKKNVDEKNFNYKKFLDYLLWKNYNIIKPETEENLEKLLPLWFLSAFNKSNFPSYFLDMIYKQHIIISAKIQDFSRLPTFNVSFKIISVIFRLLTEGITNANILKYTVKGSFNNVETDKLDCQKYKINCEIPKLEELINYPLFDRKSIFLNTIGISEESLLKFPLCWRLYIATIKYWHDSADRIFTTNYHLYSLILLIIYHALKKLKGDQSYFEYEKKASNNIETNSIQSALNDLKKDDCLVATRFFKSKTYKGHFKENEFDIYVVHAFSLFQNCLKYVMDLNALLGCPYQAIPIAEFLGGTLFYNLLIELKDNKKLNRRICEIFMKCQSILLLFVSISREIKSLL